MPKQPNAIARLPASTQASLEQLGAHLAVARLRRGESLKTWAGRLGVSIPTLQRLEGGYPGVGVGVLASALWLIGRDGALGELASPERDKGALELDVREAMALGKSRSLASANARITRASKSSREKDLARKRTLLLDPPKAEDA